MKLALFDFDGTISTKDSFRTFIPFAVGKIRFIIGVLYLIPFVILYFCKILKNWQLKQITLKHFFKNWPVEKFQKKCSKYNEEFLPKIVKQSALNKIAWHKKENHKMILVSAGIDLILENWAKKYGFEILASQLEVNQNNKLTGKIGNKNCWGPEKVNRIKEKINLNDYNYIYAYGNSRGDKEMLELADEPFYCNFK